MTSEQIATVGVIGGLVVAVVTISIIVLPHVRRYGAVADVILGEGTVYDRAGEEFTPGRPGLAHRLSSVEEAITLLTEQTARLDNHEQRLSVLETATFERLAAKVESAAMLRMIADERNPNPQEKP